MKSGLETRMITELNEAEDKAIDALSRYKFQMFGYWASIWVHLNRISEAKRPNPFRQYVIQAKADTESVTRKEQPYRDTRGMDRFYGGEEPPFAVNDEFARTGNLADY